MKLIIGLGNPGEQYNKTRHNLGFRVVDELADILGDKNWRLDKQANALIIENKINEEKIILAKPQTLMNNSGQAANILADYYKIPTSDIIVIHDDADLSLGAIKTQKSAGSAGHKGVQSVINALKINDFTRIRIGIAPKTTDRVKAEEIVLKNFTDDEEAEISQIIKKAALEIKAAF